MKAFVKKLTQVPIENLAIGSYQRDLQKTRVKKLVKEFDPMGVGTIPVSKRDDGLYYILDGQHRVAAMKELGFKTVDCEVYEGMSLQEEAKKFHLFNDSNKNHPLDDAKAKHVAGEEVTLQIDRVLGLFGQHVDYQRKGSGIKAYQTLVKILKAHGATHLTKTVYTINCAFYGDTAAFNQNILQGVSDFISEYEGRYEEKELFRRLGKVGLEGLMKKCEVLATMSSCTKPRAMKATIVFFYDRNKSKKLAE